MAKVTFAEYIQDKKFYKVDEENGKRKEISAYDGVQFTDIVEYLNEYGTDEEKAEFKKNFYSYANGEDTPVLKYKSDGNGHKKGDTYQKTNFINAKKKFFEKHAKELMPVKKEVIVDKRKEKAKDIFASW